MRRLSLAWTLFQQPIAKPAFSKQLLHSNETCDGERRCFVCASHSNRAEHQVQEREPEFTLDFRQSSRFFRREVNSRFFHAAEGTGGRMVEQFKSGNFCGAN